jgi:hypothetical protein
MAALGVMLAAAGLCAALPWVLSSTVGRRLLKSRADAVMAPGSVEFASIRLAWFQPTEVFDVVLRDRRGTRVLAAPRARYQLSLWQILFARPKSATLNLPGAELDVERFADGTINLVETLEPILRDRPKRQLIITLEHGRLRFRDGALPAPVVSDEADIRLDIAADPEPIALTIALGHVSAGREPGRFALNGSYSRLADRIEIGEVTVETTYGRFGGSGSIDTLSTAPQVDFKGSLEPDWAAINAVLVREVEPNARIAGQARAWRLAGAIARPATADDWLGGLHGELGIQVDTLDAFGMRLGATALVVRAAGGRLTVDPIDTRLNEGILHVEPEWVRDSQGSLRLKLGPTCTLENAVVNDEVSHRVLSYVAPVLDGATRVQGRVSVKRVDAEFPLFAATGSPVRVEGDVLFDDVRFLPGPLADDLMSLFPNSDATKPLLVLRDPISFRVAEGKVHQRGLTIPLGKVGSAALEGSVDFQKNLDLVARFSLNPPGPDMPVLATILRTARFELPIRGTLDDPKIDVEGMKERLKSMGSDLLGNSVIAGAGGLLRFLEQLPARRQARKVPPGAPAAGPPNRPVPTTPEERRRLRQERRLERLEKKAQRRLERQKPSD